MNMNTFPIEFKYSLWDIKKYRAGRHFVGLQTIKKKPCFLSGKLVLLLVCVCATHT